jgi:elongation factor 1-alpha
MDYKDGFLQILINKIHKDGKLDEEIEQGFLEYKLRLDKMDKNSIKKLQSQMLWRINEGKIYYNNFKAYYVIGINDDGNFGNITSEILDNSLEVLTKISDGAGLKIDYIFRYNYEKDYSLAIVIIKKTIDKHLPEINMFLLGNTNSGKTTFLGNLCYDTVNDNNGKSKLLILKHKHEIYSGKTSSIHHEIIGIKDSEIINYRNNSLDFNNSWDNIYNKSDLIINIFDSPGEHKFLKTTYSNLLNINPEIVLIFINNHDFNNLRSILHKIKLCIFLKMKFYLIFIDDLCHFDYNTNIKNLQNYLKNNQLICNLIDIEKNKIINSNNIYYYILNNNKKESIETFEEILINIISKINLNKFNNTKTCFDIYEVFDIPNFNKNTIISGKLVSGEIEINNNYYINSLPIRVINIHNKNIDSDKLYAGETGCLEVKIYDKFNINKTMTIHDDIGNIITTFNLNILINKKDQLKNNFDELVKNKMEEFYINSKFINGSICVEEKIVEENTIIFKLKSINKILINKIELPLNDKILLKINDEHFFGTIINL